MKKVLLAVGVTAVMSVSAVAADYVLKFSHVVSENTP